MQAVQQPRDGKQGQYGASVSPAHEPTHDRDVDADMVSAGPFTPGVSVFTMRSQGLIFAAHMGDRSPVGLLHRPVCAAFVSHNSVGSRIDLTCRPVDAGSVSWGVG